MAGQWYPEGLKWLIDNGLDAVTQMKAQLLVNGQTPNEAHNFRDDLSVVEAGSTPVNVTVTTQNDLANSRLEFVLGADIVFSAVPQGETVGHLVLYDSPSGAAATDRLLAFFDLSSALATNDLDITITRDATDGELTVSYGA